MISVNKEDFRGVSAHNTYALPSFRYSSHLLAGLLGAPWAPPETISVDAALRHGRARVTSLLALVAQSLTSRQQSGFINLSIIHCISFLHYSALT